MKSYLASLLAAATVSLGLGSLGAWLFEALTQNLVGVSVEVGGSTLALTFGALLIGFAWLFIARRPVRVIAGREKVMEKNLGVLTSRMGRKSWNRYVWSTRLSHWPLSEGSEPRTAFRNALNRRVDEGVRVRRLWQISSEEDLDQLETYLRLYRDRDNISIRAVVGSAFILPELLCYCGRVASVSIPQENDPRRITVAFHFRSRAEVRRWESYFEILWEAAVAVKSGPEVDQASIDRIRRLTSQRSA